MKLIPILFSTPMVQAVLDGRKIITRRTKGLEYFNKVPDLFKTTNKRIETCRFWDGAKEKCPNPIKTEYIINSSDGHENKVQCPYGQPGDILWVRETFISGFKCDGGVFDTDEDGEYISFIKYRADGESFDWYDGNSDFPCEKIPWKPSIHMPKTACRLFLKVKSVRVERLQDVSEDDAKSEGVEYKYDEEIGYTYKHYLKPKFGPSPIQSFETLWRSINGEKSWKDNPWVWVIEFERVNLTESEKQFFSNNK